MKILQGNFTIALWVLKLLGVLGTMIAAGAHFLVWHTIDAQSKKITATGLSEGGMLGLAILGVYVILLLLDSVYSILPAVLLMPYVLEQVIGTHLLRYMPLESTKLGAGLYLYLPFGAFLILIGAFAPILYSMRHREK